MDINYSFYGFYTEEERELFRNLLQVSGIGANIGQMILSSLSPNDIQNAIINEDVSSLKNVKGIGAKSAQRIIIDLKDKIGKSGVTTSPYSINTSQQNTNKKEAIAALVTLGFNQKTIEQALDTILQHESSYDLNVETLVKRALKKL